MKGRLQNSPILFIGLALFILLALPVTWTGARPRSRVETPSPQPSATAAPTAAPTTPAPTPPSGIPAVTGVSFRRTVQNVPLPTPEPEPPQGGPYPAPDGDPAPAELPPRPAVVHGQGPASLRAPLYVTFDRPVSPDFLETRLSVSPAVQGQVISLDVRCFSFTPDARWSPDTEYTVSIEGTGRRILFTFSTRPLARAVLPQPRGPSRLDVDNPVRITFGYPVDDDSVASAVRIEPDTPVRLEWKGQMLVVTPEAGWSFDTVYTVTLEGPSITSEGIPFEELEPWSFRTRSGLLNFGPRTSASWETVISLEFTRPVDRKSVEQALQFTPPITGTFSWLGQSVRFIPAAGLKPDTTYSAYLFPTVRTIDGAAILRQTHQWSFATGPAVSDFGPRRTAPWYKAIWLDFDRPVDRESIEAALRITPTVIGTFEWQDRALRFVPTDGFEIETLYEVELGASAVAADGSPLLRSPFRWEFAARRSDAQITFGGGPNLQVLDAAGPRLIQFGKLGGRDSAPLVQFTLYELSPERLLSSYSSSFKGEAPLSVEGLPLVRRWRDQAVGYELALPPDVPPGIYVLTVGELGETQDELIVVLTHHTLVLKEAAVGVGSSAWHQVVGYARDISSGQPRPGMAVRLYDRSGRLAAEGTTDAAGLFETTVQGDTEPLLAIGEVEGEWTLCGLGREWKAWEGGCISCHWWGWWTAPAAGRQFRSYVYTDRPIYRPGQEVQVKAVVRADADAIYTLPPLGTPVTVRLRDARDNVIGTQELTTGAFGSVHTTFALADGGTLGTYHVEVVVGEEVTRQKLKVEAYRKPDYSVTVEVNREQCLKDETIKVTVEAHYYFGQPVAGATVRVQQYRGFFLDSWYADEEAEWAWETVYAAVSGQTDAAGCWEVELQAKASGRISLEATVEDGSGQSVSSHTAVKVHERRYGLSTFLDRYTFKPGEPIPVDVLVTDYQGAPVKGAALTAALYGWKDRKYSRVMATTEMTTDAAGRAHGVLQVAEQGSYRLKVSGANYGTDEASIWVYDPLSAAAWYGPDEDLQVVADKPSYAVGEVAHLLVRSPVQGTAMLTLERGQVRRAYPVQLSGLSTTIDLPIEADFAPNIFATVQIYRATEPEQWDEWYSRPDAELLIASTELAVPVPERRLQVQIVPDRETYAPRDEAAVTLQVTDGAGRPVQAELSLAVIDEAIYALSEDLALHPFEAFYARRERLVQTYQALEPIRYLYYLGGRGGGGDVFNPTNPRRDFPDTAYWNPSIVTDENGRAVVAVRLPDSLTTWRLVARAVTVDTLVGEGTAHVVVAQPVVVRPAVPRFLVQGDTFTLTASVHNYSDSDVQVRAGLQVEGLLLHSPLTHTLGIAAGETARAAWALEATALGSATVTAYAAAPGLSDAVQYTIPVVPFAVPEVSTWAGEVVGERIERFHLPEGFIPEVTQLEVRLAPSVVPALLDGLEYLVDYPFG